MFGFGIPTPPLPAPHDPQMTSDGIDVIDADAGLTSLRNADCVIDLKYDYVFGLKGNQTELFAQARKLLLPLCSAPPEIETTWEFRNQILRRRRLR